MVTAAVLASALLHACWNAAAHRIRDRMVGFALIGVSSALVSALVVPWVPIPHAPAWPYLLASVATHVVYMLLLVRSYRLGDFTQMYPLARGTSPLVVAVLSATVVGQALSAPEAVGVVVVSAGLLVLAFGGGVRSASAPAVTAAVLTGLSIAGYTVLDGVGVRRSGSAFGYAGWLFLLQGVVLPVAVAVHRGPRQAVADSRPVLLPGLASGIVSMTAYGAVIWAQTRGNLAAIASLRETSILFGALIGVVFFRERFGAWRVLGAAVTLAGVLLVTV